MVSVFYCFIAVEVHCDLDGKFFVTSSLVFFFIPRALKCHCVPWLGLSIHLLHWAFVGAFNLELDGQPSTLENFRPLKKLSSLSCCLELKIVRWALPGAVI